MVNSVFTFPQHAEPTSETTSRCGPPLRPFIGGPENAVVKVGLEAAVSSCVYNPIAFYGHAGVGKSHLLELVVGELRRVQPNCDILSLTASDFVRAMTAANELGALDELRTKHRLADYFILDDLQVLAGNGSAQIELLHTLDARIRDNRQVLIASRASLAESDDLLPGLRSRLAGGLVLSVAKPAAAARHAIIDRFAQELDLDLPQDVQELLLQPGRHHVRRLETVGQLKNLLLELSVAEEPTRAAVNRLLAESAAGLNFSIRRVTTQTARYFQVKTSDLTGPSRRQATVFARGIAIYLVRKLTSLSLTEIGHHFGGRDHSTVLHSYRKIELSMDTNPVVRKSIESIADRLGATAFIT